MSLQLPPNDDTLFHETEAAPLLGYKNRRTLDRHRRLGIGPAYIKLGRGYFYRGAELRRHILAQEQGGGQ